MQISTILRTMQIYVFYINPANNYKHNPICKHSTCVY